MSWSAFFNIVMITGPNNVFFGKPLTCLDEVRKLLYKKEARARSHWETFKSMVMETWKLNDIFKNHGGKNDTPEMPPERERREKYLSTLQPPISISHWLKLAGSHFSREPRTCDLHRVSPSSLKQSKRRSVGIGYEGKWSAYKLSLRKTGIEVLAK